MVLVFMIKRKLLRVFILIISLVCILNACNKTSVNQSKDNNTVTEPAKVDSISNTANPSMAPNNKEQISPDVSTSTRDSTTKTKIMSSEMKQLIEVDFEVSYKNVIIGKNTKIDDITKKLGFPADYEANNQGYISGNAKYRRWNLCYPNYSNPEIRIIVLSEREYVGEEVKDGDSYIVGIYFEEYSTNRGLKIGDELTKVLQLYGKPDIVEKEPDNAEGLYFLRYSKDGSNLDITLDKDMKKVKYIFIEYKKVRERSGEGPTKAT